MEAKDIEFSCKLGEGAYGAVHKGKIIKSGEIVAVKTVKLADEDEGITSTTLR
jgi:serine/threonine protein kinase